MLHGPQSSTLKTHTDVGSTLSGYKRAADVKRWLRDNGVPFFVQPSGHPVTTTDAVNRAMCGASAGTASRIWKDRTWKDMGEIVERAGDSIYFSDRVLDSGL